MSQKPTTGRVAAGNQGGGQHCGVVAMLAAIAAASRRQKRRPSPALRLARADANLPGTGCTPTRKRSPRRDPTAVRDEDGISAAVLVRDLVAALSQVVRQTDADESPDATACMRLPPVTPRVSGAVETTGPDAIGPRGPAAGWPVSATHRYRRHADPQIGGDDNMLVKRRTKTKLRLAAA